MKEDLRACMVFHVCGTPLFPERILVLSFCLWKIIWKNICGLMWFVVFFSLHICRCWIWATHTRTHSVATHFINSLLVLWAKHGNHAHNESYLVFTPKVNLDFVMNVIWYFSFRVVSTINWGFRLLKTKPVGLGLFSNLLRFFKRRNCANQMLQVMYKCVSCIWLSFHNFVVFNYFKSTEHWLTVEQIIFTTGINSVAYFAVKIVLSLFIANIAAILCPVIGNCDCSTITSCDLHANHD